jgi:hypothetical protein
MTPEQAPTPITALSSVDHGDDMQMRVRYQSTYAAIVALGLLLDETGIQEIYCEQHEDVLIRRVNGKFQGCQVKTRLARLGPFKADDAQISGAISRFIELDLQFPGSFERFIVSTNVGLWQVTANFKTGHEGSRGWTKRRRDRFTQEHEVLNGSAATAVDVQV